MILPNIDIWRTARILVERYGDDATTEVAMRADELVFRSKQRIPNRRI